MTCCTAVKSAVARHDGLLTKGSKLSWFLLEISNKSLKKTPPISDTNTSRGCKISEAIWKFAHSTRLAAPVAFSHHSPWTSLCSASMEGVNAYFVIRSEAVGINQYTFMYNTKHWRTKTQQARLLAHYLCTYVVCSSFNSHHWIFMANNICWGNTTTYFIM